MVYKISNLILFVALICVALAWCVDRRSLDKKLKNSLEGVHAITTYSKTWEFANCKGLRPDELNEYIESELAYSVFLLFQFRFEIETATDVLGENYVVTSSVANCLNSLECTSADEFLTILRRHWGDAEYIDLLTNPENADHDKFVEFVDAATRLY